MPKGIKFGIALIVVIVALFILNPVAIISSGERGVVLTWGAITATLDEGFHFRTPFAQKVVKMNVRTHTVSFDNELALGAASKDLQDVKLSVVVNFHPEYGSVDKVYSQYRENYEESIVAPLVRETSKSVASEYTAEELVTKRTSFSSEVAGKLEKELTARHFVLETFSVVNLEFSKAYSDAIEAKVTQEQNTLAAQNRLKQVQFEADQRLAQAEAEAKAIQIQAQAITQQGGESYVSLKAVEKWDGVMPTYITAGAPMPFLNVSK